MATVSSLSSLMHLRSDLMHLSPTTLTKSGAPACTVQPHASAEHNLCKGVLTSQVSATELSTPVPWGNDGTSFGQALLQPTVIYVQPLLKLMSLVSVKVLTMHPNLQHVAEQ